MKPTKRFLKRDIDCVILIFAFAFIFMGKWILPSNGLVSADLLKVELPWGAENHLAMNFHNSATFDGLLAAYPWSMLKQSSLLAGEPALWNPYQFSGTPFAANAQSSVFYPVTNAILLIAGVDHGLVINALIHLWLAGAGMFLLCRSLGAGREGALFSSLAFMLCGWFVAWLTVPSVITSAAWLPFVFLFYHVAVEREDMRIAAAGAVPVAMQLLSGMLQIAAYTALVIALLSAFTLARRALSKSLTLRRAAYITLPAAVIFLLGGAIGAVQILPSLELLSLSVRATQFSSAGATAGFLRPLSSFVTIFMPSFYGSPLLKNDFTSGGGLELMVYSGAATLLLSFLAVMYRRNGATVFFALLSGLSILLASESPLYLPLARALPFMKMLIMHRFAIFFMFSAALLSGFGIDAICKGLIPVRGSAARVAACAAGLIAAAAVLTYENSRMWPELSHAKLWAREAAPAMRFLAYISLSALTAIAAPRIKPGKACALFFALMLADLLTWGMPFNTASQLKEIFPPSELTDRISNDRDGPFRITTFGTHHIFIMNTCTALQIQDVRGYDTIYFKRYHDLVRAFQEKRKKGSFVSDRWFWFTAHDPALLKLLNVKYVMSNEPLLSGSEDFKQAAHIEGVFLYRFAHYTPRARLVRRYSVGKSDEDQLRLMMSPDFKPDERVVLDKEPVFTSGGKPVSSEGQYVRIESWKPQRIVARANVLSPSILVFSEINYPGWYMKINGKPAPHITADYTFRAAALKAGNYRIEFYFSPRSVIYGLAISFAAAFICFISIFSSWGIICPRSMCMDTTKLNRQD